MSVDPTDSEARARWLLRLSRAYRTCFEGDGKKLNAAAKLVLGDLYNFCHQGRSPAQGTFTAEQVLVAEGRRQVYLQITNMLRADDADLYEAAVTMAREQRDVLDTEDL